MEEFLAKEGSFLTSFPLLQQEQKQKETPPPLKCYSLMSAVSQKQNSIQEGISFMERLLCFVTKVENYL